MQSLGWDVRDPDEVELEFPTIDGKSVDYAPKINRKPVLFIEAKPLNDPLTDVKFITQVVGYAANAGVEWCILTNGNNYKVYRSTEKAEAPEKLLFEISIDEKETEGLSIHQIAELFYRLSREAMAKGLLDEIGEQIFTTGKIRKALNKLFMDPPNNFLRILRSIIKDDSIKPTQVKDALKRLWFQTSDVETTDVNEDKTKRMTFEQKKIRGKDYTEDNHLANKPQEILELYRMIDKFCKEISPSNIQKKYLSKYIAYSYEKNIFCSAHIQKSGLRVWLKLKYSNLENPPEFVRDVSNIGHWGVGNVELTIDSIERFQNTKQLILKSFEENKK